MDKHELDGPKVLEAKNLSEWEHELIRKEWDISQIIDEGKPKLAFALAYW